MDKTQHISRQGPRFPSEDYRHLLKIGIGLCQELAGDSWTDYNEHDPGLTILEQLCFALTDLAYRTHYEIEDILAERMPGGEANPLADTFFPGDLILTGNPATLNDYRNLIYDRIDHVENVWLKTVEDHPLGVRGLYSVLIEPQDLGTDDCSVELTDQLRADVERLMQNRRNLAEDIDSVKILKPCKITAEGVVVIGGDANPTQVLANVLIAIQEGLIPDPELKSVDEYLKENIPPEEIFAGPRLDYGAVDERSLKDLPTEISVGKIRNSILGVAGVVRVKNLKIREANAATGKLKLETDTAPSLNPSIFKPLPPGENYSLHLETEGGSPCSIDRKRLWKALKARISERRDRTSYDFLKLEHSDYFKLSKGRRRNIENYFSIQHHFPMTYGIGRFGVPEDFGSWQDVITGDSSSVRRNRRLAQSRQLKAYLLFFEQLLANYLAQLSHAPDLFSLNELDSSYFSLSLAHHPELESDPPNVIDVLADRYSKSVSSDPSRYAICVVDYPSGGENARQILLRSEEATSEEDARWKGEKMVSAGRHKENYLLERTAVGDIGLLLVDEDKEIIAYGEERFVAAEMARQAIAHLAGLLGDIHEAGSSLYREHIVKVSPKVAISVRLIDEKSRVLLTSRELPSEEEREKRAGMILKNGVRESNYECRHHNNGEIGVILRDKASGDIIAHGEKRFSSPFQAEEEIKDLVARLTKLRSGAPLPNTYLQRLPDSDKSARRRIVEDYRSRLQAIVKDGGSSFLRRRNRFLDHLLARFNEAFDNDSLLRCDPRNDGESVLFYRELAQWKIEFLKRYVDLSGGRGRGLNCVPTPEDEFEEETADFSVPKQEPSVVWQNRSGLEQRLYLLLGLHGHFDEQGRYQPSKRPLLANRPSFEARHEQEESSGFEEEGLYVVEHILLRPSQRTGFDCRGRISLDESGLCLECRDPDTSRQWVRDVIVFGADPSHYRIESDHGGYYSVLSGEEEDLARGRSFNSESEALEGHLALSERILELSQASELELPASPVKEDFYSFRISIFLPNWTKRLANKGFRHFAENVIGENCPAHIAYRCYWLDKKTFHWFETLYAEWESAKLNPANDPSELDLLSNALKGFIEWLSRNFTDEGEIRIEPDRQEVLETDQGELPHKLKDTIYKLERRRSRPAH